ncbi:MAG: head GIN domain-containing protein [Myxococcales bacterium]
MRSLKSLALLSLVLWGLGCEGGNGELVSRSRGGLQGFSIVESAITLPVVVQESEQFAVTVTVDSNLQDLVEALVEGETLRIGWKRAVSRTTEGSVITVAMPQLRELRRSGSGSLKAAGMLRTDDLVLTADGSGKLAFEGPARNVTLNDDGSGEVEVSTSANTVSVKQSGSGSVALRGSAATLTVASDGSGAVAAKELVAQDATLVLSGSGSISATVNGGAVDVSIDGSGEVHVYGDAVVNLKHQSGNGSLHEY